MESMQRAMSFADEPFASGKIKFPAKFVQSKASNIVLAEEMERRKK